MQWTTNSMQFEFEFGDTNVATGGFKIIQLLRPSSDLDERGDSR
jgi:hypothetical protein